MKRYDTIHSLGDCRIVDFELPEYKNGDYIADRSHFTPVSELAKSVVGQSIGKTDLARYDFADGVDNGMDVPLARRRPELAEMSVDVRRQQRKVKEKLSEAERIAKLQSEAEAVYASKKVANEASSSN